MNTIDKWPDITTLIEDAIQSGEKEKLLQALVMIARIPKARKPFREYLLAEDIITPHEYDEYLSMHAPDFEPLFENNLQYIRPALDFIRDKGIAITTTEILARIKDDSDKKHIVFFEEAMPFIITSQGQVLECLNSELKNLNLTARTIPSQALNRWHPKDIKHFVEAVENEAVPQVDLNFIFQEIRKTFKDYLYFKTPEIYDFIGVYVIATYFYQLFPAFPLLVLFGPKQSGKSLNLQLMEHLAFNALLVTDPTPAVIYRTIEELGPTLLLDEIESLGSRREYAGSFMSILRASYKRIDVPRMEERKDGGYKLRFFQAFGPKVIATIQGIEDVLANRSIIINLVRRRSEDTHLYKDSDPALEKEKWRHLRNQLYLLLMTRWQELDAQIKPTMEKVKKKLFNRELELWTPFLSIANWIDQSRNDQDRTIFTSLLEMALEKSEERKLQDREINHTVLLLQALLDLVKPDSEPEYYSNLAIREKLEQFFAEPQGWMNETWIGRLMARIGITDTCRITKETDFMGQKKLTHYKMDPAWLQDYCERYGVDLGKWGKA